jgi:hypothetical protein
MPADLPPGVEWVKNTLGDMSHVQTGSVDLVFAGEVIEHVWPDDVANFLCEAHRVLRPDGWLVLDSPNRRVTHPLAWHHPEHTVEYTVEEMVELLLAGGFGDVRVRGLWLCYDRDGHRLLPLMPPADEKEWTFARRIAAAAQRPEDSFIWWMEARRASWPPNRDYLRRRAGAIFEYVRPITLARFANSAGLVEGSGRGRVVHTAQGEGGILTFGPFVPLAPGRYKATFHVAAGEAATREKLANPDPVGELQLCGLDGKTVHVRQPLTLFQLTDELRAFPVTFELSDTLFGAQLRVVSTGRVALKARLHVDLDPA